MWGCAEISISAKQLVIILNLEDVMRVALFMVLGCISDDLFNCSGLSDD